MKVVITSDIKNLTKGKSYTVLNHIFCRDMKTIVDDSGYYRTVYSKDYKMVE